MKIQIRDEALKGGYSYTIQSIWKEDYYTATLNEEQHLPEEIEKIANHIKNKDQKLVYLYFTNPSLSGNYYTDFFNIIEEINQPPKDTFRKMGDIKKTLQTLLKTNNMKIYIKVSPEIINGEMSEETATLTMKTNNRNFIKILQYFTITGKERKTLTINNQIFKRYLIRKSISHYINSRCFIFFTEEFINNRKITLTGDITELKRIEEELSNINFWITEAVNIILKDLKETEIKFVLKYEVV